MAHKEIKWPVKTHYFKTTAVTKEGPLGEVLEWHYWDDMKIDHMVKWRWYFDYRAALLKVKYPRAKIITSWGTMAPSKKSELEILQGRLTSAKRKITEWENRIKRAEEKYDEIFPIEDHVVYQKAKSRLQKYRFRYFEIKAEIQQIEES